MTMMRELCRTDLYYLLRYALGRTDMERQWLFDRCRDVQNSPNGHLDLWAREHYKSTIITFGLTIQDILSSHGRDPHPKWNGREVTIGIFSFNRPTAKGFLRQIKQEFENNIGLKTLFPDILYMEPKTQAQKWSEDEGLTVRRRTNPKEATIEASGLVDGQPTSKHYFIRLYDDVVTIDSVRSGEMVKKTTEAWELSINLGAEGGIERYVGTFYADGDTYHEMIERQAAEVRKFPGSIDGTATGKPVFMTQEMFDKKRRVMGPYTFSTQILLDPIPSEDAYFSKEDFQWYDREDLPSGLLVFGASDFAVSEGKGDWTEHGIAGIDSEDDLYLIDWWSGQTKADVWIDKMLKLAKRHKPMEWGSESGQIRRAIEPFLKKRMQEMRVYLKMKWFTRVADKATSARSFQARASQGKVYLPRGEAWAEELYKQLLRFPRGKYDDKVDVCAIFGMMLEDMRGIAPATKQESDHEDDYGYDEEDDQFNWKTA